MSTTMSMGLQVLTRGTNRTGVGDASVTGGGVSGDVVLGIGLMGLALFLLVKPPNRSALYTWDYARGKSSS